MANDQCSLECDNSKPEDESDARVGVSLKRAVG